MTKKVIYDSVYSEICMEDDAITADTAKKILGWEEDAEGKFGTDYLLKLDDIKVRCHNNVGNRPISTAQLMCLRQEILRKRWNFNGEPIIIGEYGSVLNGQHSLLALISAAADWESDPASEWDVEPTIEKLVVFGVEEKDSIINTLDTCKPRSLADVIYRSPFFADLTAKDRKTASRICDYAIRTLWERLGSANAFSPRKTHSESIDFLNRHSRLLETVNHIFIENVDDSIGKYVNTGCAAGLQYLMASSASDPDTYMEDPAEFSLDWSNWDKAEEFFVLISSGSKVMRPLRTAMKKLIKHDDEEVIMSSNFRAERITLLINAWNAWIDTDKVPALTLKYKKEDGFKKLAEFPSTGGIDLIDHTGYEKENR